MTDSPMKMRICYFGPEIPALSQTFVYREILALRARGHFVLPVTIRKPGSVAREVEASIGDVAVLYETPLLSMVATWLLAFFRKPLNFIKVSVLVLRDVVASFTEGKPSPKLFYHYLAAFTLADIWERERIGHCHVHFVHFPAQIAMYASAYSGVPWTVMAHANDIYESGLLLKDKAERAKAMVMISEFNRATISDQGAPADKMPVVRCGVSAPVRTIGLPQHHARPFLVGSLGRLVEKKGMATTIRAFKNLKQGGLDVHLEIVGDGPLLPMLEREIAENDLGDYVTLKGAMPNDKVLAWLQSLSVFCLACQRDANGDIDGIPVALMEAMALGVPVVSTNISGVPELVQHETSGLLCEPQDEQGVALAIQRYYDDAAFFNAMRTGGVLRIEQEFSEAVNIARLENLFSSGTDL